MTIHEMKIGDTASFTKTISESDIYLYAGITGDNNPQHINAPEAERSIFGQRVAHGMLVAGLISAVLGTRLPGSGTVYLGQTLKFTKPVFFGDTVTATVTVAELKPEKNICIADTVCTKHDGTVVIEGQATLMPPRRKTRAEE